MFGLRRRCKCRDEGFRDERFRSLKIAWADDAWALEPDHDELPAPQNTLRGAGRPSCNTGLESVAQVRMEFKVSG